MKKLKKLHILLKPYSPPSLRLSYSLTSGIRARSLHYSFTSSRVDQNMTTYVHDDFMFGGDINMAPMFCSSNFSMWRHKMQVFLTSQDFRMWLIMKDASIKDKSAEEASLDENANWANSFKKHHYTSLPERPALGTTTPPN